MAKKYRDFRYQEQPGKTKRAFNLQRYLDNSDAKKRTISRMADELRKKTTPRKKVDESSKRALGDYLLRAHAAVDSISPRDRKKASKNTLRKRQRGIRLAGRQLLRKMDESTVGLYSTKRGHELWHVLGARKIPTKFITRKPSPDAAKEFALKKGFKIVKHLTDGSAQKSGLHEVSKAALGRYVRAASHDLRHRSAAVGRDSRAASADRWSRRQVRRLHNRLDGIDRATRRMEEGAPWMASFGEFVNS